MKIGIGMAFGDSHGRVWPEPMQEKSTKSSWWYSVKEKLVNGNFVKKIKHDSVTDQKF